jgi:hypothetical protein
MISASCHCGGVRVEAAGAPQWLTSCNCSICRRLGALWAHYTRREARLLSDSSSVAAYVWNDRVIEFYHCVVCGCSTHYESVEKDDGSRFSVNARCMPPEAIANVRIRTFDGAGSWKYID